uniref:Cytochrome b-c1 complex subunit 1, mitochondrial-like n=1 Tax=Sinocyclocheilus grahami TaxID=75366 RepID=A0A672SJV5_SINGR
MLNLFICESNLKTLMLAYTSREHTAYYMKTLAKDLPKAVELLAEVVQSSSLSEADIELQRSVVLRELEEVQGSLQDVCLDVLHATAFQGTPLGHSVIGPSANARTLTRNDLVEYINSHYKAPRMVLATAGGVNHDELVGLAKQHFSGVSFEYEGDAVPVLSPCRFTGSEIRMRDDAMPLAHIAIAVEGAGVASPDIVLNFHFLNICLARHCSLLSQDQETVLHKMRCTHLNIWVELFWNSAKQNFILYLLYAPRACNTPKRKEKLKSHHLRIPISVSAVGPIEQVPDYNRMRSAMYWLRF